MTTSSGAPFSAGAVANEFLRLGQAEPNVPPIDQMKLQKLIFYAHAWHLAIKGQPLFEEDVEAWPWGPVVRSVYSETRSYGRGPVTGQLSKLAYGVSGSPSSISVEFPRINDTEALNFIKSVWETNKGFTGIQLSNSTHAAGEPWTVIKDFYGSLDAKPLIPNDVIRDIFRKKLKPES